MYKKGENKLFLYFFLSAKGADGGSQILADMSAKKSPVKWRQQFTLGTAILDYKERGRTEPTSSDNIISKHYISFKPFFLFNVS